MGLKKERNGLVKVYSGTALTTDLLKIELEKIGVPSIIRNGLQSGNAGGFFGGTPTAIELLIRENDLEKAGPVISEFIKLNTLT